jgi:hypothetical protein
VVGAGFVALLGLGLSWPDAFGRASEPVAIRGPELSAGEQVDGLELTAVLEPTERDGHVSFLYGDCVAADDAGCAPPAEVQVWRACTRPLTLYDGTAPGLALERATVRGVPAVTFDGGRRIELETGDHTVVVFADSPDRAARIAAALHTSDGAVGPGAPLPDPAHGGREGVVDC